MLSNQSFIFMDLIFRYRVFCGRIPMTGNLWNIHYVFHICFPHCSLSCAQWCILILSGYCYWGYMCTTGMFMTYNLAVFILCSFCWKLAWFWIWSVHATESIYVSLCLLYFVCSIFWLLKIPISWQSCEHIWILSAFWCLLLE